MSVIVVLLVLAGLLTLAAERIPKLPKELLLVLGGLALGAVWQLAGMGKRMNFDAGWANALLCALLFAQAYRARLCDVTQHKRVVGIFSVLSAVLFAAMSGGILLLCTGESMLTCFAAGAALSAMVPAPVLYVLRRAGIPEETAGVIEGVSLFGSGTAVTLAALLTGLRDDGILGAVRSLGGGLALGAVMTVIFVLLFRQAKEERTGILLSLCAAAVTAALCGLVQASAPVAVFLLGIGFAVRVDRREQRHPQDYIFYRHAWQLIDEVLSSTGVVLAGALCADIVSVSTKSALAVVLIPIARFVSVCFGTLFCGTLPQKYKKLPFSAILTASGTGGCLQVLMLSAVGADSAVCWIVSVSIVLGIAVSSLTAGTMLDRVEQRRRFDAPKSVYHD